MYTFKIINENQNGTDTKFALVTSNDINYPRVPVNVDDKGKEYFEIPNPNLPKALLMTYYGRIWDAISAIRSGHGDVIIQENPMKPHDVTVGKYVDTEYGKTIREKSINGFKDVTEENIKYVAIRSLGWSGTPFYLSHETGTDSVDISHAFKFDSYDNALNIVNILNKNKDYQIIQSL